MLQTKRNFASPHILHIKCPHTTKCRVKISYWQPLAKKKVTDELLDPWKVNIDPSFRIITSPLKLSLFSCCFSIQHLNSGSQSSVKTPKVRVNVLDVSKTNTKAKLNIFAASLIFLRSRLVCAVVVSDGFWVVSCTCDFPYL